MSVRNAYDYLIKSADAHPDKTAFSDSKGSVTFSELRDRSLAIGTALADMGCERGAPVAVLCERSVDAVCAFMGALAAGCFYVPLDRKMPEARLSGILNRLMPAAVLCTDPADMAKAGKAPAALIPDLYGGDTDNAMLIKRRERVIDADPVYMIFTSGSTGEPKGILIPHRALVDFIEWMAPACGVDGTDVMGNQAPFYFDLSVKDIWLTVKCAATTHIIPQKCFMFPRLLIEELNCHGVTALIWATSAFSLIASSGILEKAAPVCVRKVILGGEALRARDLNIWRRALPDTRFINLYGPTEVTVDCTYYVIDREFSDTEPIPIGRPCANMDVLLLDKDLKPVKDGETGEICVRGTGLALGYFKDPERTALSFIQNPVCDAWPDTVYRTGDLAYMGKDGLLYFANRADGQIKHSGYRIELGEIETALSAVPNVRAAVCLFDKELDRIICAYEGEAEPEDIIRALRLKVPRYMLPNIFKKYAVLPRNRNGKIDRPKLRGEYENGKSDGV